MLFEYSWLIPLVPLIAGLLIIFGLRSSKVISSLLSISAIAFSLIYSILLFVNYPEHAYEINYNWLTIGNFNLSMGLLIDSLAIIMLLVVCSVSLLVQIYSHGYMSHDKGYSKFFAFLSLFSASMLALVISTNLFQMYIFWELVGLCSYLLIGFWHTRPKSGYASVKAFVMNRIGDFGFLLGILLLIYCSVQSGSFHPHSEMLFLGFTNIELFIRNIDQDSLTIIGILLFMGAMAKSAQFPLHTWLPDAMEGPTPISALIHAATMVAAGVFLLARIFPILMLGMESGTSVSLIFIACTGAFTALYAALIALTQNDIKKALAYSTCSQLGLMIMSVGCGAWIPAMFHLVTHAFFKSLLFLGSGSVIHGCSNEQDMRKFGGLRKYLPITAITFLIGTMAISAVPLMSGFWSKELILSAAWSFSGTNPAHIVFWVSAIASMLTCFYMFRIYFMTFTGEYRGTDESKKKLHESPWAITLPLILLTIPSIFLGLLGTELDILGGNQFAHFLGYTESHHLLTLSEFIKGLFTHVYNIVPLIGTLVFITLAYFVYKSRTLKFNESLKKTFIYEWASNKFYLDEFYELIVDKVILPVSRFAHRIFDMKVLNHFIFNVLLFKGSLFFTKLSARIGQNGQTQGYILSTLIIFLIIYFCTVFIPKGSSIQLQQFVMDAATMQVMQAQQVETKNLKQ